VMSVSDSRRAWSIAWLGGAALGVANGVVGEATYAKRVGEQTAHNLSALSAIAAFAGYFALLHRRWPLASERDALRTGGLWLVMTVAFEFGFGRLVAKLSWQQLLADYNVARGRTWPFVLAWIGIGPAVMRRTSTRSRSR
jgi:hypothetical protein